MFLGQVEWFSAAGGPVNDDGGGAAGDLAWILDGATGLHPQRLLPGPSDAAWLVEKTSSFLSTRSPTEELGEIIGKLCDHLVKSFSAESLNSASSIEPPSASMAVASMQKGILSIATIGDCCVLVRDRERKVYKFGESPVTALDNKLKQELVALQQSQPDTDYKLLWKQLVPLIQKNRALKNKPGGYWVIDPTDVWPQYVQYADMSVADGTQILMVSDGFYRLIDHYYRFDDNNIFDACINLGIAALVEELRHIEDGDSACREYPRLKPKDDASALLMIVRQ